jgi:hypothetical protein
MSFPSISARTALVAMLVGSPLALNCGARSDLTTAGDTTDGGGTSSGGSAGALAGRGGALGSGGAVGTSGTTGTGGAGTSGCPSDLDSNPKHCGACNHDCEGGECRLGSCKPVLMAELRDEGATALALDETHVYWARPIMRMPKGGGTPELLSRDTPDAVWGIAVDSSHVFWGSPTYGPVRRVPKLEATAQALTRDDLGANRVAVDATGVYFTSHGVWRMGHDGSALRRLTAEGDTGLALDSEFVYFTSRAKGEVYRMTKDGLGLTVLAKAALANEVAVHGDFVVFTEHGLGTVRRVSRNGGADRMIAGGGDGDVAVDADGVYFTTGESVGYVPIDGFPTGEALALALDERYARAIATDETRVFWTTDAPRSAVFKLVKSRSIKEAQ